MAKKPDFSDLTSKFDIEKIVGGIKSMMNPEGSVPDVDPDDALGMKVAQLGALFQEMAKAHSEMAKDCKKADAILSSLFKDIEALRNTKKKPAKKSTKSPKNKKVV